MPKPSSSWMPALSGGAAPVASTLTRIKLSANQVVVAGSWVQINGLSFAVTINGPADAIWLIVAAQYTPVALLQTTWLGYQIDSETVVGASPGMSCDNTWAAGFYMNTFITNIAAGAHTLKVMVRCDQGCTLYGGQTFGGANLSCSASGVHYAV